LRQELYSSASGGILVTDALKGVRTEVLTQHELYGRVEEPNRSAHLGGFSQSLTIGSIETSSFKNRERKLYSCVRSSTLPPLAGLRMTRRLHFPEVSVRRSVR